MLVYASVGSPVFNGLLDDRGTLKLQDLKKELSWD